MCVCVCMRLNKSENYSIAVLEPIPKGNSTSRLFIEIGQFILDWAQNIFIIFTNLLNERLGSKNNISIDEMDLKC